MAEKEKYSLEYYVKSSQTILYYCLSAPEGLAEWFAKDVIVKDNVYTFVWENYEEEAILLGKNPEFTVRWQWMEDREEENDCYFEFKIQIDEITKEKAIIVTDFAEPEELDSAKRLWNSQIDTLLKLLGN